MIKNYFKIAWRSLKSNKGYSVINIGGLAIGMAVAVLIGLWLYDELSFNKYHKNYDRIAEVMVRSNFNGQRFSSTALPRPLEAGIANQVWKKLQAYSYVAMERRTYSFRRQ